jgi:hypothetical protein
MTVPWYRRTLRWGQTNLTEIDPARYDSDWWRAYWRRTKVQGVIVNAGGIVAYYPSKFGLQHRARFLGDGDLYGDIVRAARAEGLTVLARMDSNRADPAFYDEHPDWFAVDASGVPYRAGEKYVACVNSPYYRSYLPEVLEEIIARSAPDGITDNSWSGLDRSKICYCVHCRREFRADTGRRLPSAADWDAPDYRAWIEWSYAQRLAVWDLNNATTTAAGGPDCLWVGMNSGQIESQSARFRDYKGICERTPIIMLDSQYRAAYGFQANSDSGKLIHGLLGWDALIPESTALYDAGTPTFRVGSKPAPEARMWAVSGFAGGIQPWWHHIGASHEDRRQYETAEPLFGWHASNEEYLVGREPLANVGLVWSQRSVDFHGREDPEARSVLPYRGFADALIRARIPYLPVNVDHIERDAAQFDVLVVPNVGALSDAQSSALRAFVNAGGNLVVTGESGRYDEWGDPRPDLVCADLLGVRHTGTQHGLDRAPQANWESYAGHTYLRLERPAGPASALVAGFDSTDLLPCGGRLDVVRADEEATVVLTWVPPFPIYPPETSWMERPRSSLPALTVRTLPNGARLAYLAADVDRCFGRHHHPDHGRLLANVVRWAAGSDGVPLTVEGPGVLDCNLYRQGSAVVLHLVNLSQGCVWQGRLDELLPVGPLTVTVAAGSAGRARLLVAETETPVKQGDGRVTFTVPSVLDHEVVVLDE